MDEKEEIQDGFVIDDDYKADWAVQKIAEERREYERIKSIGERQIDEIKKKLDEAKEKLESKTGYLTSMLADYFHSVPHKVTKTAEKYKLLSGELTEKKASKKAVYDNDKLVEWLAANGMTDYIKTEQEPRWGDLKKTLDLSGEVAVVKETGEVVDCITFEDVPKKFEIKTEEKKKEGE